MIIIIMGIAGCGKTTIGKLLAENLQWPFYDADDFHLEENVRKMKNNRPLSDMDRMPWLELLRDKMHGWEAEGNAVLACSALKESYRELLQQKVSDVKWVFLKGTKEVIEKRILRRKGHFMKTEMLESQFEALEEPEYGLHIRVNKSPEHIIQRIRKELKI